MQGMDDMILRMIREHSVGAAAAMHVRQTQQRPFNTPRKQDATFLQLLLIDGTGAVWKAILEKRGNK